MLPITTILGIIALTAVIALAGVLLGFRMGRIKGDEPVVPPQAVESGPPMREEDPYHEAMYGVPQERIPTVEVKA